jgi:RNA polymerase sigma-70 factor (ECF subfamily)
LNYDDTITKQYESEPHHNYGNPESTLERNELKTALRAALMELPESYQSVLILRYQLDLNNHEIAETLGVSKENVEVKIHRARKALRKIIIKRWEERGIIDELPGY